MDEDCAAEAYTGEDYEPEVYTGEGCAAEEPEEDPVYAMTEDQKTGADGFIPFISTLIIALLGLSSFFCPAKQLFHPQYPF